MADIILDCPQCKRQLRVPEYLVGQPVKCPACGTMFTVRSGAPGPYLSAPVSAIQTALPGDRPPTDDNPGRQIEDWQGHYPARDRATSLVTPPAIGLLVSAVVGFLADLVQVAIWATRPELLMQQVKAFHFGPAPPPQVMMVTLAIFAALSVLIIFASISMLRRRLYSLALTGSFLSMMNCGSSCCLLGLPFGIWAIIVLLRSDVRSAFE